MSVFTEILGTFFEIFDSSKMCENLARAGDSLKVTSANRILDELSLFLNNGEIEKAFSSGDFFSLNRWSLNQSGIPHSAKNGAEYLQKR